MSTLNDRAVSGTTARRSSPNIGRLAGRTRSRLEDKYGTILNKYSGKRHANDMTERGTARGYPRKQEQRGHSYYQHDDSPFVRDDKTLEPSVTRTIVKSPTNVLLSEKAYPYVSSAIGKEPRREKTPAYSRIDRQTLLNSETYRRYGRHKSGHAETRSRKVRPHRNGKSEQLESNSTSLALSRPVKIGSLTFTDDKHLAVDRDKTPIVNSNNADGSAVVVQNDICQNVRDTLTEADIDPTISDRAAKRKEIQSLILKYAAMEDTYSQLASGGGQANARPSMTDIIASKYRKSNRQHNSDQKDSASKGGTVVASNANVISEVVDTIHGAIVSCRTAARIGCALARTVPL